MDRTLTQEEDLIEWDCEFGHRDYDDIRSHLNALFPALGPFGEDTANSEIIVTTGRTDGNLHCRTEVNDRDVSSPKSTTNFDTYDLKNFAEPIAPQSPTKVWIDFVATNEQVTEGAPKRKRGRPAISDPTEKAIRRQLREKTSSRKYRQKEREKNQQMEKEKTVLVKKRDRLLSQYKRMCEKVNLLSNHLLAEHTRCLSKKDHRRLKLAQKMLSHTND